MCLLGGETAEMPGIYNSNCYDIVGTIIGLCDKGKIIDGPKNIQEGDLVFGMLSSGPHTNGYSLIRKIIQDNIGTVSTDSYLGKVDIKDLVKPHKSYLGEVNDLLDKKIEIKGLCHITGGGYKGNIERVLPDGLGVELSVPILEPFATLQKFGNLSNEEMYQVFNCGYGMLFFVRPENRDTILNKTTSHYLGKVITVSDNSFLRVRMK
jgi:phosphoribosylformylglycinamidine cyclo-ligase